jgi:hypothetical protein
MRCFLASEAANFFSRLALANEAGSLCAAVSSLDDDLVCGGSAARAAVAV